MKILLLSLLSTVLLSSCTQEKLNSYSYESKTLKIIKVSERIFKHVSFLPTEDFGNVPCNGMIYINGMEAIVFDTPTNNGASMELIQWVSQVNGKEIKAIVVNHFHNDCLGGLQEFHDKGIESYSSNLTISLAQKDSVVIPSIGFDKKMDLNIGGEQILTKFFGEGHTKDNVVSYIPSEKTLFGGCLIKEINAGKGYLGHANIEEWTSTVSKVKAAFPDLEVIVPGHGKHGGLELLDYTMELFKLN